MTELSSIRCAEISSRLYSRSTKSLQSRGLYQGCLLSRRRVDRNSHCCDVMKISNRQIVNGDKRRGIQKLLGNQSIDVVRYMYMSRGLACRAGESELAVESESSANVATVEIRLHEKHVEFGQAVAVIGSGEVLGNWAPEYSIPLVWTEGDVWTGQVTIPKGSEAEFKFIVVFKDDGTEVVEWEECNNRLLGLPEGVEKVSCWWNDESRVELVSKASTDDKNGETKKSKSKSTKKPKANSTKAKEEKVVHEEKESSISAEDHTLEPEIALPSSNNDAPRAVEDVKMENEEVVTYNFDNGASSESASEMAKRLLQNE